MLLGRRCRKLACHRSRNAHKLNEVEWCIVDFLVCVCVFVYVLGMFSMTCFRSSLLSRLLAECSAVALHTAVVVVVGSNCFFFRFRSCVGEGGGC